MDCEQKASTRVILLSLLEDIEIVSKELLEYMGTGRQAKQDDLDPTQLINLLREKDKEFQDYMQIAKEQGEIQKEIDELRLEVDKRDAYIRQLQRNLKETEELLSTIIFEAKLKLKSIKLANEHKISSEELIKYAHKISASNSVACPSTWMPGDPRRPYPTEIDMRQGLLFTDYSLKIMSGLSQFGDRQMGVGQYQQMGSSGAVGGGGGGLVGMGGVGVGGGSLTWQPSAEVQSTLLNRLPSTIEPTTPSGGCNSSNNMRMLRDYSVQQQQQQLAMQHQQLQQQQQQQLTQQQLLQHDGVHSNSINNNINNSNNNSSINNNSNNNNNMKDEVELMSSDSSSSSSSDE